MRVRVKTRTEELMRKDKELETANQQLKEKEIVLQKANEELKYFDRLKDEFISIASHELRTPIQPILSLSETLRSRIGNSEYNVILDVIIRSAKRLQHLTEDLLEVTRIESQTLKLKKEKFVLTDLVSSMVEEYKNKIDVDKREGGTVSINIEKENNSWIIVSVRDSGIGIDPEIMPRLFTKFTSKSLKGTGLGLFISKGIIEAHGGRIWAENNIDGIGATFSFSLPLLDHDKETN
jgi:signal transduction histidine kinase